jgi:hypothetical protein
MIAAHFGVARDSVKMILATELGLKEFSKRWMPHQLTQTQKMSQSSFLETFSKLLNTIGSCNSTE